MLLSLAAIVGTGNVLIADGRLCFYGGLLLIGNIPSKLGVRGATERLAALEGGIR